MCPKQGIPDCLKEASSLEQKGQTLEAIAVYQQALEIPGSHQDIYHRLGLCYAQQKDWEQAKDSLKQAIQLNPRAANVFNHLGNVYKNTGEKRQAAACYLKAIRIDQSFAKAHHNLAILYADQQPQKALKHYHAALQAEPDFTLAHYHLGLHFLKQGAFDHAKIQFQNVLALEPQQIQAHFYLGSLLLQEGDLEKAKKAFLHVLKLSPEHLEAWINLGVIALKENEAQSAIHYFTQALAFDNENEIARSNLAATFIHHDRYENALTHYQVLLKKHPKDPEYLYNTAVAQMALGKLLDAQTQFNHLLTEHQGHIPALQNLAAIHLKLQNKKEAARFLKKILDLEPEHRVAKHMLSALSQENTEASNTCEEYAEHLFNHYAYYYDQHLQGPLHYSLPQQIEALLPKTGCLSFDQTLDLGCGTGLTGEILRKQCKTLIGVDIAEKMIQAAKNKKIYDNLIQADLLSFLKTNKDLYALVVAGDVLPYFGDLAPFFKALYPRLKPEAYFIFNTEISENAPWHLDLTLRFSHRLDYIQDLCANLHLQIIQHEKVVTRYQNEKPLHTRLFLVKKV